MGYALCGIYKARVLIFYLQFSFFKHGNLCHVIDRYNAAKIVDFVVMSLVIARKG